VLLLRFKRIRACLLSLVASLLFSPFPRGIGRLANLPPLFPFPSGNRKTNSQIECVFELPNTPPLCHTAAYGSWRMESGKKKRRALLQEIPPSRFNSRLDTQAMNCSAQHLCRTASQSPQSKTQRAKLECAA